MAITLTNAGTTLVLPADLAWADEFSWAAVVQHKDYTLTGALLVENAAMQAGRPITLEGSPTSAWALRSTVQTLKAWAAVPGLALTLLLRGASYSVAFDHERGAIEAQPLVPYSGADFYAELRLRFIEV